MEKNKEYRNLTAKHTPKSNAKKHTLFAFLGGGCICLLGEGLAHLYSFFGADSENAYLLVTLTFILLGSVLTALGLFDKISNYLYAGVLVPVTGFSNSVTSAALDTRQEGYICGVGAKIFTVAGPVLLYGTLAGAVWGVVYWIISLF